MLSASSITIPDRSLEASRMTRPAKTSTADCPRPTLKPLIMPEVGRYQRHAVISDSLNSSHYLKKLVSVRVLNDLHYVGVRQKTCVFLYNRKGNARSGSSRRLLAPQHSAVFNNRAPAQLFRASDLSGGLCIQMVAALTPLSAWVRATKIMPTSV